MAISDTYNQKKKETQSVIERMERESDFMFDCLENYVINLEEYQILTEGFWDSIANFFRAILNFFRRIFGTFKENSARKTDEFRAWLKENGKKLDAIEPTFKIDGISPLWKGDKAMKESTALLDKHRSDVLDSMMRRTANHPFIQWIEKILKSGEGTAGQKVPGLEKFYNKDNDLNIGAKNYFRFGNADIAGEVTNIPAGDEVKKVINIMKSYCAGYHNNIVMELTKEKDAIEHSITKVENESKIRVENYLFLGDSDLQYCINYSSIVQEAGEQPATGTANPQAPAQQTTAKNDNTNNAPQGNSTVNKANQATGKVSGGSLVDTADKKEVAGAQETQKINQIDTQYLELVKYSFNAQKTIISSAMTIGEEKFTIYFNMLQSIASKSGTGIKTDEPAKTGEPANNNKQEPSKTNETPQATEPAKPKTVREKLAGGYQKAKKFITGDKK
jgi:hypothetical protein